MYRNDNLPSYLLVSNLIIVNEFYVAVVLVENAVVLGEHVAVVLVEHEVVTNKGLSISKQGIISRMAGF